MSDSREAKDHARDDSSLRVTCATWNVNSSRVGLDSLVPWLCPSAATLPPHIVAVGLQELVDLKDLKHYVNDEESKARLLDWSEAITMCLKDRFRGTSYSVVKRVALVGTGLVVVCQTHLLRHLRDIKRAKVATGAFGVIGNKGGCGLRFRLLGCGPPEGVSFCFVVVHLAAHQSEVQRRNQDWEAILGKLYFLDEAPPAHGNGQSSPIGKPSSSMQDRARGKSSHERTMTVVGLGEDETGGSVLEHDLVFIMGDLNYRIDADDQITVLDHIRKRQLDVLLKKDQLLNEMRHGRVGKGFSEAAEITFPPTFKFQPGTSKYDTRSDKKKRIPSWCDRILFRNALGQDEKVLRCDKYRACMSLVSSDHKPVAADFTCEFLSAPARPVSPRAGGLRPPPPPPAPIKTDEPLSQFAVAIKPWSDGDFVLQPGDRIEVLSVLDAGSTILGYCGDTRKLGFCSADALKPIGVFQSRVPKEVIELGAVLLDARLRAQHKKLDDVPDMMVFEQEPKPGSSHGKQRIGLVPFPDDEDEDEDTEPFVVADSGGGWYRATVDFNARKDDEISFRRGEMVEIISQDSGQDGWWIGRARHFDQGLVPAFCFLPVEPARKGNAESTSPSISAAPEMTRSASFEFDKPKV